MNTTPRLACLRFARSARTSRLAFRGLRHRGVARQAVSATSARRGSVLSSASSSARKKSAAARFFRRQDLPPFAFAFAFFFGVVDVSVGQSPLLVLVLRVERVGSSTSARVARVGLLLQDGFSSA